MDIYTIIKVLHVVSSTILFGTGLGIAFFMFRSRFTESVEEKHYAVRTTVLADYLFTAPAVCIQPITGLWLVWQGGFDWTDLWLLATYIIYVIAGVCWLPVVWLQIKMKSMLAHALESGEALPKSYETLFRLWFILGWPAFIGLVIVFFLMVIKPV